MCIYLSVSKDRLTALVPCDTESARTVWSTSVYNRGALYLEMQVELHGRTGKIVLLQCVAVCGTFFCSCVAVVLQRVAVCFSVVPMCCSVLQCVAVVLQLCCSVFHCVAVFCSVATVCCSVLQRAAVCCSVLQCVAVCCK